ncbi:flagellar protein FlaG [Sediminibacillus massiliensis]|uniref:flagellar protein FlaG n=1 Tax=Sediminibacillus massiliensis TaxID=1926277 RepID=UPI0009884E6D|nr:flagellar protein FlaG [Sediminibacillus massiliensis]
MNVGRIISGSQLLQKAEHIEYPTSAEDRSITEIKQIESNDTSNREDGLNEDRESDKQRVKDMVEALNEFIGPSRSSLKFEYHEKLEKYYATIIDTESNEVIKEIPPKKLLDMYASMAEMMGFIVDEKI